MARIEKLEKEYFSWLVSIVGDNPFRRGTYQKLLHELFHTDFRWTINNDCNRADDGVQLRERFERVSAWSDVDYILDRKACSVLEMMIALAMRCEEHIMGDAEIGDRTPVWFWNMVSNLGLSDFDDENMYESCVRRKINIFLNRKYQKDGDGGLFTVSNPSWDMRKTEIYYQMCYYLNEILEGESRWD